MRLLPPVSVASSPLPGGPRHVGRVIDPSVREDGEPEPAVELEAERLAAATEAEPQAESSEQSMLPRGGRAREILLERAHSVEATFLPEDTRGLGALDEVAKSEGEPLDEVDLRPPGLRPPSAPLIGGTRAPLSPNLHALFGTLLGVATVASLVALGMNIDLRLPAPAVAPKSSTAQPASGPQAVQPEVKPRRVRAKQPGPWRISDAAGDSRLRMVEAKVGSDPFLKALEKAGVEVRETYRILTAMKGVRDFDHCRARDQFKVLLDRASSRVKAFEYVASAEEVYQAREGADGLLKGSKLDLKVERKQTPGALVYDGKSFDASAVQGGFEHGLAKAMSKALDGHMSLDDIEAGARLRVLAQEVTVLGEFARYSGIEALEIQDPNGSKPFRLYYFAAGGERGYFDAEGHSPYEGGWRKPIKDAPMTSPFNLKRLHPILKKVMPHLGIDFGAPMGTPVGAASYGTVSLASYIGPTGNLVKIEHANGIETGYAHLSRFAEGLKVGDHVKRLQIIGYVGSTGRSTGPHLHFSARKNGDFIDPASLNLDAMRTLSKENRAAFAEAKAKYDQALDAIALPAAPLPTPVAAGPAPTPSSEAPLAAPPAASGPPGEGEEDEETTAAAAPASETKPTTTGAQPSGQPGSAVYLSDKELLKLQGAADEGEVDE